tara:strand:- start:34 stop:1467 length:1434 start_codon:yes stop_codon:yes gene_type:complete
MNFHEFEEKMNQVGFNSLAEIARALDTTPQAVSNWKSRDQVPYHIIAKISNIDENKRNHLNDDNKNENFISIQADLNKNGEISFSDILVKLAEQTKVIALSVFMSIFMTFTYVVFVQEPIYQSSAKLLLPKSNNNYGAMSGLASQFGINTSNESSTDLSSTSLLPEIMNSRVFARKILEREFYTKKIDKKLPLYQIFTHGNSNPIFGRDTLIAMAIPSLNKALRFENSASFSLLKSEANEPELAKALADSALKELEGLNKYFRTQSVTEKISFINQRIFAVGKDLNLSEIKLRKFKEQNRQISSPSLELDLGRLNRDVQIQNQVYVTLKQQLELAKIEEVQEKSVMQVLDYPELPLGSSNFNLRMNLIVSGIIGLLVGITMALTRSYLNSNDINERKKFRKVRRFINKKSKEFILDYRVSGVLALSLLLGMPFYLGHESSNPIFFGRYSLKLFIINIFYIIAFVITSSLFIKLKKRK